MCDTTEADFIVNYFSDAVHNILLWIPHQVQGAGWEPASVQDHDRAKKCPDLLTF